MHGRLEAQRQETTLQDVCHGAIHVCVILGRTVGATTYCRGEISHLQCIFPDRGVAIEAWPPALLMDIKTLLQRCRHTGCLPSRHCLASEKWHRNPSKPDEVGKERVLILWPSVGRAVGPACPRRVLRRGLDSSQTTSAEQFPS